MRRPRRQGDEDGPLLRPRERSRRPRPVGVGECPSSCRGSTAAARKSLAHSGPGYRRSTSSVQSSRNTSMKGTTVGVDCMGSHGPKAVPNLAAKLLVERRRRRGSPAPPDRRAARVRHAGGLRERRLDVRRGSPARSARRRSAGRARRRARRCAGRHRARPTRSALARTRGRPSRTCRSRARSCARRAWPSPTGPSGPHRRARSSCSRTPADAVPPSDTFDSSQEPLDSTT